MASEIEEYFPHLGAESMNQKEFYVKLLQRAEIQLDYILGLSDDREKLKPIDDYFYEQSKPKQYWGHDGEEIQHDKIFDTNCIVMSQHVSVNPKDMTVREYYTAMEELKNQFTASTSK